MSVVGMYNKLVGLRNRFKNAYAQIDVQLKRRYDLIPNLVETAKGYLKHERDTLRCLRPGSTLSSLGVYSGKLQMPFDAFSAGLADHRIVTPLCPGGKERMRRLLTLLERGRFDPTPLITHRFSFDAIPEAYQLLGERADGVLKVAVKP